MKIMKTAGISALSGIVSAVVFLLAAAFFMRGAHAPEEWYGLLSILIAVAAALISAAVLTLADKDSGAAAGLLTGLMMCSVLALLSFIPGGEKPLWQSAAIFMILLTLPAAVRLIIRRASSKKRPGRKRRRASRRRMQ